MYDEDYGEKRIPIQLDSTRREIVSYSDPSFPLEIWTGRMSDFLNSGLPPHWHREVEYAVVTSGSVDYVFSDRSIHLEKDDAIIIKPECMHYIKDTCDGNGVLYTISFLPTLLDWDEKGPVWQKYVLPFLSLDFQGIKIESSSTIVTTLENIYSLDADAEGFELFAKSHVFRLWNETLAFLKEKDMRTTVSESAQNEEHMKRALSFIYSHYSEKITVDDIAVASYLSRTSLFRKFSSCFGKTPLEILNDERLSRAASLLETTDHSVTRISLSTGFTSSSYFTKSFREKFGVTPLQYRKTKVK